LSEGLFRGLPDPDRRPDAHDDSRMPRTIRAPARGDAMILAVLGLGGVGLWFLVAGDGPARLVGLALILVAALFGFLLWVAIAVERPSKAPPWPEATEAAHG
jgi:cation transporter-like permease